MSRKNQRRAAAPQPSSLTIQARFEALLRRGTELLQRGRAQEAIHPLELAHQLQPDDPNAAHNLSSAYLLSGRFKKAAPLVEKLLAADPENAQLWLNRGAAALGNPVLATDEQQREAIAAFTRALELDPAIPNAAYNIGLVYRDRGETAQAIHWFQRTIQINPRDTDAQKMIARLQQAQVVDDQEEE
jgi:protein O-GlcNAc transferase